MIVLVWSIQCRSSRSTPDQKHANNHRCMHNKYRFAVATPSTVSIRNTPATVELKQTDVPGRHTVHSSRLAYTANVTQRTQHRVLLWYSFISSIQVEFWKISAPVVTLPRGSQLPSRYFFRWPRDPPFKISGGIEKYRPETDRLVNKHIDPLASLANSDNLILIYFVKCFSML